MNVCKERELIYFRVPATGSTTFIQSCGFWPSGADHITFREAQEDPNWGAVRHFKKITLIRHPVAWVESMYAMCIRAKTHWREYALYWHDEWASPQRFLRCLKVTPLDWVADEYGIVRADTVYRIEDLDSVCAELGVTPTPGHWNKTWDKRPIDWSDNDLAIMRDKFQREFAYYSN